MSDPILNLTAGLHDPWAPDVSVHAAVELARQTGARLHLVHALPPAAERPAPVADEPEGEILRAYAGYLKTI